MKELDKVYAEHIAKDYSPKETTKVMQLEKLNKKAKRPAHIFAITFGIVAALVLGTGMCFAMGQFGNTTINMIIGIIVGCVGIIMGIINYPIFKKILESSKKKYAFEILELAKQITEAE